ncbi:uncharacterized protein LOC112552600, partial [Pogonomyrmex barbatus]|uniref:Uncharacterized protein LOC112552600 n=1 Tax=Pogonomyrmex barbatus TaxID=144034 RepID=A0A8N1S7A4_9HYME
MAPQCLVPTVKHRSDSIVVWGCFCGIEGHGIGDLIKVDDIMRKEDYKNILMEINFGMEFENSLIAVAEAADYSFTTAAAPATTVANSVATAANPIITASALASDLAAAPAAAPATAAAVTPAVALAVTLIESASKQTGMEVKIDWLIRTVRKIKDEVACKNEIKTMIAKNSFIREELKTFRRKFEEVKRNMQEKINGISGHGLGSYSAAVKNKKKESILIIQPLKEQESKTTKKLVKEKIDIKKMEVGITKLRKGSKGSVILGCESEGEMEKLKDTVREKLGEDFKIIEL